MMKINSEKVRNRWIVVIGAILIQLALGAIYSWGAMTIFLSPYLNQPPELTIYIFGMGLLSFAITMIFAGKLQQKYGPRKIAMVGAFFLTLGTILSSVMTTLIGLLITYGVLFGIGIGFAYICPIACCSKWFPDKKGLINGIAVAGFGAGSFIFNFLIKAFAAISIPIMFLLLGILYFILVFTGALILNNPPEGWVPENWNPPVASEESAISGIEIERKEMVKLPQFWMLWVMYALCLLPGLIVIGSFAAFSRSDSSFEIFTVDFVLLGSLAALFNGAGRILWGKLADQINYKKAIILLSLVQGVLMLIYFSTNISEISFILVTCAIYFCFGGCLSLFPTATADLFGTENLGENYGIMFTAYGVAGMIGALGVNLLVMAFGSYLILFIVMGLVSFLATLLTFILKPPKN